MMRTQSTLNLAATAALLVLGLLFAASASAAPYTSYNDCVYDSGLDGTGMDPNGQPVHYTSSNVTYFGIGNKSGDSSSGSGTQYTPTSGSLVDFSDGTSTGVTATFTQNTAVSTVQWQPQVASTWTGGYDTAASTDARNTFGGIVDMTGTIYYGASGWWVDLSLTGLDPTKLYTFATSASRAKANTDGGAGYDYRVTIYTLS
ncbi:MAG: hypothetical protein JRJ84_23085, partial [Deltaproteobacteria bacterium]|nr:hypothetical protein [Deltaproteobacteria bacterium]